MTPQDGRDRLLFEAWSALKGAMWAVAPWTHAGVARAEITPAQAGLLSMLQRAGAPQTPQEIARTLSVTPATVTGALNRLEESGLVARARESADRRVVHVHVTPAGQRVAAAWVDGFRAKLEAGMAPLSDAQLRTLVEILSRLGPPIHGPPGGFGALLKAEAPPRKRKASSGTTPTRKRK
jgi:DNA-binding MarR family transcriptional regulator